MKPESKKRYIVINGSASKHCCFEASVIDTNKSDESKVTGEEVVCECFDADNAQTIADALNDLEDKYKAESVDIAGTQGHNQV